MSNKIFMAFGKTNASTEGGTFKKYIGLASVFVDAINPNKAEWEKIFNATREDEITYLGKTEVNGKEYPQLRVDFILRTDPESNNGIETTEKISFFLVKSPAYGKNGESIQVINAYGETTYIPVDCLKTGVMPMGQEWFLTKGIRPAYIGEANLTNFLKAYLNIAGTGYKDKNGNRVVNPNLEEAECRLDLIDNYFDKGDVSEIKEVLAMQAGNKVKVAFGVKRTDEGKVYTDIYNRSFLKHGARQNQIAYLDKEIMDTKASGGYPNTEFDISPLREYNPEATEFKNDVAKAAPVSGFFSSTASAPIWNK